MKRFNSILSTLFDDAKTLSTSICLGARENNALLVRGQYWLRRRRRPLHLLPLELCGSVVELLAAAPSATMAVAVVSRRTNVLHMREINQRLFVAFVSSQRECYRILGHGHGLAGVGHGALRKQAAVAQEAPELRHHFAVGQAEENGHHGPLEIESNARNSSFDLL